MLGTGQGPGCRLPGAAAPQRSQLRGAQGPGGPCLRSPQSQRGAGPGQEGGLPQQSPPVLLSLLGSIRSGGCRGDAPALTYIPGRSNDLWNATNQTLPGRRRPLRSLGCQRAAPLRGPGEGRTGEAARSRRARPPRPRTAKRPSHLAMPAAPPARGRALAGTPSASVRSRLFGDPVFKWSNCKVSSQFKPSIAARSERESPGEAPRHPPAGVGRSSPVAPTACSRGAGPGRPEEDNDGVKSNPGLPHGRAPSPRAQTKYLQNPFNYQILISSI